MEKLIGVAKWIGIAVLGFFVFGLFMTMSPLLLVVLPAIGYAVYRHRTREEREMMRYVESAANEEAERIRLQARAERIQAAVIGRALRAEENHGRGWRITKTILFWAWMIPVTIVGAGIPLLIYLLYLGYRKKPAT